MAMDSQNQSVQLLSWNNNGTGADAGYTHDNNSGSRHEAFLGLQNLGNCCFMNATLQCLFSSELIVRQLVIHQKHSRCPYYPDCMSCTLYEQYKLCQYSNLPYVMYRQLPEVLKKHNYSFSRARSHDPYDFLVGLLNKVPVDFRNALLDFKVQKSTSCTKCRRTVEKVKPFDHLSLSIENSSINSVPDAVRNYFKQSDLSKYFCLHCSQSVNAETSVNLTRVPGVLVIKLQRFREESKLKITKKSVEVTQSLQLHRSSVESGEIEAITTSLFGVLMHTGSNSLVERCHYYCYVRRDGHWYKADDSNVQSTSWKCIVDDMSTNGYLLFYSVNTDTTPDRPQRGFLGKRRCEQLPERPESKLKSNALLPAHSRETLRELLMSKDNKEKSWIMIQIAVNCFKKGKSANRAKFLRESLKSLCPDLRVRINTSEDWPIVKSQNSFFNKICNVVETVLKYGKLDIREDSPEKPYLLANVKDNRTTLNTDDVFENGFSLKLRDMLDPGKKDIKSLVKVGETRSEMEERRKQGGTSTDKPTPMAWDYAVYLGIEFLRTQKKNRTAYFESKMSRFCQNSSDSDEEEISKNSSQAYFNASVNILEMVMSNFKLYEKEPSPKDYWFDAHSDNIPSTEDQQDDPVHPTMYKLINVNRRRGYVPMYNG